MSRLVLTRFISLSWVVMVASGLLTISRNSGYFIASLTIFARSPALE